VTNLALTGWGCYIDTPDDKTMLCALMQGVRAEGPLMAEVGRKNIQKVTLPQFMKLTEEFIHHEELVGTLLKALTLEEQAKQEGSGLDESQARGRYYPHSKCGPCQEDGSRGR
jgi:hypothetical protein